MKTATKYLLQKILGLHTYLYVFSLFVITKIRWDKKEKDFFYFIKLIREKGIILDLGANIGVTCFYLSKKLPDSTILAFEPLEINMNILKRLKRKFRLSNVHEYQLAVGNENTVHEMVLPVIQNVPMHGLSHIIHDEIKENNTGLKYKVPMVRLDDFTELANCKGKITGLKIDVENFEYYVLSGARNLLQQHKPIIYCELWENENREKCFSLLNEMGYASFVLVKNNLIPFVAGTHKKHNFFFIPDSL